MPATLSTPSSKRWATRPSDEDFSRSIMTHAPLGFEGSGANLYRYCGNGPTDGTDPSGLEVTNPSSPLYPWWNHPEWKMVTRDEVRTKACPFWAVVKATMESEAGEKKLRTFRMLEANTIVVDLVKLGHFRAQNSPPFDVPIGSPGRSSTRVGVITCGAEVYNSGIPNPIPGFPRITGVIGFGEGRLLEAEKAYVDSLKKQGMNVSSDEGAMNAGGGNSGKAFYDMVEAAWNAALDEAKRMVEQTAISPGGGSPYHPYNPMRVGFALELTPGEIKNFPGLRKYQNLCYVVRWKDGANGGGTTTVTQINPIEGGHSEWMSPQPK